MPHPPPCWRGHDRGSLLWPRCAPLEILSGVLGGLATARCLYQNSPQRAQRSHLREGAIPAAHRSMKPSKKRCTGGSCHLLLATGHCWKEPHTLQGPKEISTGESEREASFSSSASPPLLWPRPPSLQQYPLLTKPNIKSADRGEVFTEFSSIIAQQAKIWSWEPQKV